jgi:hypothetical protein
MRKEKVKRRICKQILRTHEKRLLEILKITNQRASEM